MAFCKQCGAELKEGANFCDSCGADTREKAQAQQGTQSKQGTNFTAGGILDTQDDTANFDAADIESNKVFAGLAYLIFFLPLIACPNSKYGRFHSNQGLVFLLLGIAGGIVNTIISAIFFAISWRLIFIASIIVVVIWLCIVAIGILGLVNGFTGKAKELPLIGKIHLIK